MLKTLTTIFLGRTARAEQALETRNAAVIIEQKIREAEAGHALAKRGLASLIVRCKSEEKSLSLLDKRIADLTSRVRSALAANKSDLAKDAAGLLANLENERTVRKETLTRSEEKAARMRLAIEKTDRQLVDLRQGLITAKAVEAERQAVRNLKGDLSASSAIREGEAVLERLIGSADPVAEIEALEDIEAELSGETMIERLADAGFGTHGKVRAADILARFETETGSLSESEAG